MILEWRTGKNNPELNAEIEKELTKLENFLPHLESATARLESHRKLFETKTVAEITAREKELMLKAWADVIEHHVGLAIITQEFQHFYRIPYLFERELHTKAFFLYYTAYVTAYASGVRIVDLIHGNQLFDLILNEPRSELDLPHNTYADLKWRVLHFDGALRLAAGYGNIQFLKPQLEACGIAKQFPVITKAIDESFAQATKKLGEKALTWFPQNAIDILRSSTEAAMFPMQKEIAHALGETRIGPRNNFLITEEQIRDMRRHMEPGDIILERRNWYLSNIGIPGFWPHTAIFLGTWEEFTQTFQTQEIRAYLGSKGWKDLRHALRETNAEFADAYANNQLDVIEAKAVGVMLNTLTESARADYVGIVRPSLTLTQRFEAALEAIKHFGKPYDYQFDFVRDNAVVCSELVYRALKEHLKLELTPHAGRMIFPPTALAKLCDTERTKEHPTFTAVYFLDGKEKEQKAVPSTEAALCETWKRAKWDIAQP
jgi:hypothetical protein